MANISSSIDVFISRKSSDAARIKELYHYLTMEGLNVFESNETLPKLGSSDYRKQIDRALDECRHMIVFGSSRDNISSSWVEAEWGFYVGEKRAGRKEGNILTVITDDLEIKDLPASLRYYEVIKYHKENFKRIASYLGKNYEDPKYKARRKNLLRSKWLLPSISLIATIAAVCYFLYQQRKPFDAILFLKTYPNIKLDPSYPVFEGGELSIMVDSKEEKEPVLPNGQVIFRKLPADFKGSKIPAKLLSKNWKLVTDSIELNNSAAVFCIPDGSLGRIFGNVRDIHGDGIAGCEIVIDNSDTTISTDAAGSFNVSLPYRLQKSHYVLHVSKDGYKASKFDYYAKSGTIDMELIK